MPHRPLLTFGLILGLATGAPAVAQAPAPAAAAQRPHLVTRDPAAAPAGNYTLDPQHAAVIARAPHQGGFSMNVLRFMVKEGALSWNPDRVEDSRLTVTVDMLPYTASIEYLQDIRGERFLNLAQFPTATFTSTAIRRTGPTTGQITGQLTLMGQTRPVTIDAEMVGAGISRGARPQDTYVIGFSGVMKLARPNFDFRFVPPGVHDTVEVLLEAEFERPAPN